MSSPIELSISWRSRFYSLLSRLLMLILLATAAAIDTAAADFETRHELLVLYVNAGAVFPGDDSWTDYRTGAGAGGGIGLSIGDRNPLSFEVVARLSGFRLPIDSSTYLNAPEKTGTILSFECKFRYRVGHWFRPYVSIGTGMVELSDVSVAAAGLDLAPGRDEGYLFYVEAKYFSPETFTDMLCLNIGIRLG